MEKCSRHDEDEAAGSFSPDDVSMTAAGVDVRIDEDRARSVVEELAIPRGATDVRLSGAARREAGGLLEQG